MRELLAFVCGVIVTVLLGLILDPKTEAEDLNPYTLQRDSLYQEMNDSLELYSIQIDSLKSLTLVHDTVEKRIYIRLQNDINQVNSINDSDSLVYLIKESIHARRTQTD